VTLARRELLLGGMALALSNACRAHVKDRGAVLAALVREVAAPDAKAVVAASRTLAAAGKALAADPTPETLHATRGAFVPALLAWKRAQCFRNGPMTQAFARVLFWPPREAALAAALASTTPIDDAFVAALGVDARGVYALEALLFPPEHDDALALAALRDDSGLRRRTFVSALGANVEAAAETAAAVLGDGSTYGAEFARQAQINLSFLVNQMASSIETLAVRRLERVLSLAQNHALSAREVEGLPSGTSGELVLAQLEGNERLYRGGPSGGLADLAEAAAPGVGKRVADEYAAALGAVRALAGPLESVVASKRPALVAAAAATKTLERGLKSEVASALGVTTTFQIGDGD
jgi:predicted lipoprotein